MNGECLSHSPQRPGTVGRCVLVAMLLACMLATSGCAGLAGRHDDEQGRPPQVRFGSLGQPGATVQDCATDAARAPGPTCFPPAPRNHWARDAASALNVPTLAQHGPGIGSSYR